MFWKKPPPSPPEKSLPPGREELIARAKADLQAARADLGEDTIAKMKALAMAQQHFQQQAPAAEHAPAPVDNPSPAQRARELMKTMDKAKLADYIRTVSREEDE